MKHIQPDESADTAEPPHHSRRGFLRYTGATAIGIGALSSFADQATAAAVLPPIVSTRDHYESVRDYPGPGAGYSITLVDGHTETDYDTTSDVPGVEAGCNEVAIVVHGWQNDVDDAREKFATAVRTLVDGGYSGGFVGYSWDADISGRGVWNGPAEVATRNGTHLAQFVADLRRACMDQRIHLVGHSLGAEVILSTLRALNSRDDWLDGYKLHSTCLFGAAVPNDVPASDSLRNVIAEETGRMYNFHSQNDRVLRWLYPAAEFSQALGRTGVESDETPPENYYDIDVTDAVDTAHSGYLDNVSDQIADRMQW